MKKEVGLGTVIQTSEPDAETKKLLGKVVRRGILEFKPTLNTVGVHYVDIEKNLKDADPAYVEDVLRGLEKQGVLESKFVDRVLMRPHCRSPEVHSKYACPKCGSYNAQYTELIEHMKCGYISSKDKFLKGSSLVCPGCRAELNVGPEGVSHREIGSCYQCEKCGYHFDRPEIVHFCQKCGRNFTYQDAIYRKIYSYKITEETAISFGRDQPILERIERILTDKGFKVQLHPQIKGASGVQHLFDIWAEKNGTSIVIDISLTGKKNDMISLLGKKVDVKPTKTLIIDLSELDELTPLGEIYDITVVKATKDQNIPDHFEDFLSTSDSAEQSPGSAEKNLVDASRRILENTNSYS